MWWPFRKKKPTPLPHYYYGAYPPIDADEGDMWWPPMYPVNDYTKVGDIYFYKGGEWVLLSKN